MVHMTEREQINTFAQWFGFRVTDKPEGEAIPGWPGLYCAPDDKSDTQHTNSTLKQ